MRLTQKQMSKPLHPHMNVCVIRKCKNKDKDKVLLVKNKKRKGWEFPGGKIDPGKDSILGHTDVFNVLLAAEREYLEETEQKLSLSIISKKSKKNKKTKKTKKPKKPDDVYFKVETNTIFLVYNCDTPIETKEITTDHSIVQIKEFEIDNLPSLAFPSDIKILVDALQLYKL